MIRRPPRSTLSSSSAASDVYKRQERFCARLFVNPMFFTVTFDKLFTNMRLRILTTNDMTGYFFFLDWTQGLKDLQHFIADRICLDDNWRFHGNQSDQLHEVILNHIAHGSRMIVIATTVFHSKCFC